MAVKLKEILSEQVTLSGRVKLYHYTRKDLGDTVVFDPKVSAEQQSYFSKNDYKLSSMPRVFYYTDLSKTEKRIVTQFLYSGEVDGSKILSVSDALQQYRNSPDVLKQTNKNAFEVMDKATVNGVFQFSEMFEYAAKNFIGVYYETMNIPTVNLFVSLECKKEK